VKKLFLLKKYNIELIITLVIIFIFSIMIFAQDFEESNLDSNIVLLEIRVGDEVKESDTFFEILVFSEKDYYLIPVNLISSYLDININYNRENNILTVVNPENNKEVKIDLQAQRYLNYEEWSLEPPIIFEGYFYISPLVIEYLYNINFNWNSSYQLLTLSGDYFKSEEEKKDEKIEDTKSDKSKKEYDIKAKRFSLSSIHYMLRLNYHSNYFGGELIELNEILKTHSRFFDWAFSIEGKGKKNLINGNSNFELSKFIGEYRENDRLIIIGDYGIDYPKTIGENSIIGIYYKYPERSLSDVFAYTSVKGKAQTGSKISLFLNERKYKEITLEENDTYNFENIPLKINRLNNIKVVIIDSEGKETILEKNIVGSTRILPKDVEEKEFSMGLYKSDNDDTWEGSMLGLKYKNSPSNSFNYDIETVINKQNDDNQVNYLLAPSIAFMLNDNKVITVDWYLTENEEFNYGGEVNAIYSWFKGYIKLIYSYIPVQISDSFQKEEGTYNGIIGVWDFSKNWDILAGINYRETLIPGNVYEKKSINVSFLYDDEIYNHSAINLSYEEIVTLYESSLNNNKIIGTNKRYGANYVNDIYKDNYRFKFKSSIYDNNIEFKNNILNKYQDIIIENMINKKIGETIWIKNDFEGNSQIFDSDFYNSEVINNTELEFNINNNNMISIFGEYNKSEVEDNQNYVYGVKYKHYFNNAIFLNLGSSYNNTSSNLDYQRYFLRFNYRINADSNINLYYNQISYVEPEFIDQKAYEIEYSKIFPSERALNILLGKELDGIFNESSDYYITVSLSHALNFSGNKILNQRYNEFGHKSLVTGIVYLDENNNKKFDKNEKKLPDIKMRLDGITTLTDINGLYKLVVNFPGIYNLNFDYNSLDTDYTPITTEKKVKIDKNSNVYYNFGLTMNGTISGQVYKDENANGKLDENEEPLQWVGVKLNEKKTTYTNKDGKYYFENVPLGQHIITFVKESLPSSMKISNEDKIIIDIKENKLDVKDINVPLVYSF